MLKTEHNTATMIFGHQCVDCGWPIVDACCNDEFVTYKDAAEWDYWVYCANKGCKNHEGEGLFQDIPKWMNKKPV